MVHEVHRPRPGYLFHPKIWLLRYTGADLPDQYRLAFVGWLKEALKLARTNQKENLEDVQAKAVQGKVQMLETLVRPGGTMEALQRMEHGCRQAIEDDLKTLERLQARRT